MRRSQLPRRSSVQTSCKRYCALSPRCSPRLVPQWPTTTLVWNSMTPPLASAVPAMRMDRGSFKTCDTSSSYPDRARLTSNTPIRPTATSTIPRTAITLQPASRTTLPRASYANVNFGYGTSNPYGKTDLHLEAAYKTTPDMRLVMDVSGRLRLVLVGADAPAVDGRADVLLRERDGAASLYGRCQLGSGTNSGAYVAWDVIPDPRSKYTLTGLFGPQQYSRPCRECRSHLQTTPDRPIPLGANGKSGARRRAAYAGASRLMDSSRKSIKRRRARRSTPAAVLPSVRGLHTKHPAAPLLNAMAGASLVSLVFRVDFACRTAGGRGAPASFRAMDRGLSDRGKRSLPLLPLRPARR